MIVMTEKKPHAPAAGEEGVKHESVRVNINLINPDEGYLLNVREPFSFFFPEEDGVTAVSDVDISVSITNSGREFFAAGTMAGTIRQQCGRCLAEFDQEINAVVEAPYFPKGGEDETSTDDETDEAELEDGEVNYYSGDTVDLFDVLHDQLFLAIPIKALCKEDCKGLCPQCGADLNVEQCSCKLKSIDPRLAELKKLKDKL